MNKCTKFGQEPNYGLRFDFEKAKSCVRIMPGKRKLRKANHNILGLFHAGGSLGLPHSSHVMAGTMLIRSAG
jgi:hypothetical protein